VLSYFLYDKFPRLSSGGLFSCHIFYMTIAIPAPFFAVRGSPARGFRSAWCHGWRGVAGGGFRGGRGCFCGVELSLWWCFPVAWIYLNLLRFNWLFCFVLFADVFLAKPLDFFGRVGIVHHPFPHVPRRAAEWTANQGRGGSEGRQRPAGSGGGGRRRVTVVVVLRKSVTFRSLKIFLCDCTGHRIVITKTFTPVDGL